MQQTQPLLVGLTLLLLRLKLTQGGLITLLGLLQCRELGLQLSFLLCQPIRLLKLFFNGINGALEHRQLTVRRQRRPGPVRSAPGASPWRRR